MPTTCPIPPPEAARAVHPVTKFPPVHVEPMAPTWTVPSAARLVQAASDAPACALIYQRWPHIVAQTEAATRIADAGAARAWVADIEQEIDALSCGDCGPWQGLLALQRALLQELRGLHASAHAADQSAAWRPRLARLPEMDALQRDFIALHDAACVAASMHMTITGAMWCREAATVAAPARQQRYLINLATDAALVHRDGQVGGHCPPEQFVALAQYEAASPHNAQVASLQGQGPVTEEAVARYLDAACAYAQAQKLRRVLFVNAAEGDGQIPSFAAQVATRAQAQAFDLAYAGSIAWQDGALTTPEGAARFAADAVAHLRQKTEPAVVVVNCNAGLDRSGITNILIQSMLALHRHHAQGATWPEALQQAFDAVPQRVAVLKRARPRAISSWGRYLFIYQALEAYVASQIDPDITEA